MKYKTGDAIEKNNWAQYDRFSWFSVLISSFLFFFFFQCVKVDDASLQDEPLQIRVMDHDTYSANDAIGKIYIDLNPLLLPSFARNARELEGNLASGKDCTSVLS
jgi:hypothetical protein